MLSVPVGTMAAGSAGAGDRLETENRMEKWPLKPGAGETPIGLDQAAAVLGRLGELSTPSLAQALLDLLGQSLRIGGCEVLAGPADDPPRRVSVAGSLWPEAEGAGMPPAQASLGDVWEIGERSAWLIGRDRCMQLHIRLDGGAAAWRTEERACLQAFAACLISFVRLHLRCRWMDDALGDALVQRLRQRFPTLTRRDRDLLAGMVQGRDGEQIALAMGIRPSSVQTYLKRLYRKLGISGQRELFGLLLSPGPRYC